MCVKNVSQKNKAKKQEALMHYLMTKFKKLSPIVVIMGALFVNIHTLKAGSQNSYNILFNEAVNIDSEMYTQSKILDQDFGLDKECTNKQEVKPKIVNFKVIKEIKYSESSVYPIEGEWLIAYERTLCGKKKTYNLLAHANKGLVPEFVAHFPGNSKTSPMEALRVLGRIKAKHPDCKRIRVCDREILEESDGQWSEKWKTKEGDETKEYVILMKKDEKNDLLFGCKQ